MAGQLAHKKNPAAKELGRKGGEARAETLAPQQRTAIAVMGGKARWGKLRRLKKDRELAKTGGKAL